VLDSVETTVWSSDKKEPRPESANSRSGWGLDGDEGDGAAFNRQKATGIDMQSGAPPMVSTHQALGINDSFMGKLGRGVRCEYLALYLNNYVTVWHHRRDSTVSTPQPNFFLITDGLILFSAGIWISRIYADDVKFDWITAECVKIRLNLAECPKLASELRLTNTEIIKCQQPDV